ncbi:hypothetical protein [Bathymodiolus platifrons methanotrophic gill symbiont]|nr:hypothetical protein [Bathymodiolus platifrons methanotrophic gill symbiont]
MTSTQQRSELQSQIWKIANEVRMIKKGQMIGGDGLSPAGQFYSLAA